MCRAARKMWLKLLKPNIYALTVKMMKTKGRSYGNENENGSQ